MAKISNRIENRGQTQLVIALQEAEARRERRQAMIMAKAAVAFQYQEMLEADQADLFDSAEEVELD